MILFGVLAEIIGLVESKTLLFLGVPRYQLVSQLFTTEEYQLAGLSQSHGLFILSIAIQLAEFHAGHGKAITLS